MGSHLHVPVQIGVDRRGPGPGTNEDSGPGTNEILDSGSHRESSFHPFIRMARDTVGVGPTTVEARPESETWKGPVRGRVPSVWCPVDGSPPRSDPCRGPVGADGGTPPPRHWKAGMTRRPVRSVTVRVGKEVPFYRGFQVGPLHVTRKVLLNKGSADGVKCISTLVCIIVCTQPTVLN